MASEVVVLGGGFAGLSCATALAEAGARVTVLEKKPHLGGRAYSFKDPATGHSVDNGQHLFVGAYRHTRRFLERVGSSGKLTLLSAVRVDFAEAGGGRDALSCPTFLGAPAHLALGVLGLKGLSLADKWGLTRLDAALRACVKAVPPELDALTVRAWLDSLKLSRRLQTRLLDPIALGVLNDAPEVAAATGFAQAMTRMFYGGVEDSRLGLSNVGLSELYTEQAKAYLEARGGRVRVSAKAVSLIEEGGRVRGVELEGGERLRAEEVVSTVPPWDLKKLAIPAALRGPWEDLPAAPIVSAYVWTDAPVLADEPLVGLLGTQTHWVFNKGRILGADAGPGQYLALVISGARREVAESPKALIDLAWADLGRCLPSAQKATILNWKVVKEPFATLSPVPGSEALRPGPRAAVPGFVFAGDWTRTGLPATIESAVVSGHRAAEEVMKGGVVHAQV